MNVVKWPTSASLPLPVFTTSHSQCHSILTNTLSINEPTATSAAVVSYDAVTVSHTAVLNTIGTTIGTYPATYEAKDQKTGVPYSVTINV